MQQMLHFNLLEKVIALKGISKEQVVVIGDGMNNLTLFQCFPYSFVPMNTEDEIKTLTYRIVADVKMMELHKVLI